MNHFANDKRLQLDLAVPSGLDLYRAFVPTLNSDKPTAGRWAILKRPSRRAAAPSQRVTTTHLPHFRKTSGLSPIAIVLLSIFSALNSQLSTCYATGGPGYAVHVGGGDYVRTASTAALNSYPFTVTAWIDSSSVATSPRGVITKLANGDTNGWQISFNNNQYHAAYGTATSSAGTQSSPLNTSGGLANSWHHLAFAVDASGAKLYLDGALADSKSWTGTPAATTSTNELRLGIYSDNSAFFSGDLDEITVWNVALTQSQIQFNMNRSLTGNESGLVLYWRCDENLCCQLEDSAPLDGDNLGFLNGASFTPSGIAPFTAGAQTLPPSVTPPTATLNGTVNPGGTNASAWFQWGATTNYGIQTVLQPITAGTLDQPVSQVINLTSNATYHYRAMASNYFGLSAGVDQSFVFSGAPIVTTLPASFVQSNRAVLVGEFNPNGSTTTEWFQWGTSTNYGYTTIMSPYGACTCTQSVTEILSGLFAGQLYHYRLVASNQFGLATGADLTFALPGLFYNTGATLPQTLAAPTPWGDYNNDGRLDILFAGDSFFGGGQSAQLWRNSGNGFTNSGVLVPSTGHWLDFDNDGRLDILANSNLGSQLLLETNTGSGFLPSSIPIPPATVQSYLGVDWADLNTDGRQDFIAVGNSYGTLLPLTYRNAANGLSLSGNTGLPSSTVPPYAVNVIVIGDLNNDGLPDVILEGNQVWLNTGNGFTNSNWGLPPAPPVAAMGDYDNDGRLDLLLLGLDGGNVPQTQIWRNTGSAFTNINAGLPGLWYGSAAWGDYDNDGRLDLLLAGATRRFLSIDPPFYIIPTNFITQVWRNTGSGFTNANIGLPGLIAGTNAALGSVVSWGDFDNDGRLDILLAGASTNYYDGTPAFPIAQLWRNITPFSNTPPAAPTGLRTVPAGAAYDFLLGAYVGGALQFSWDAATDAQTPSSGLTYNLRVGTTPGGSDLVSPSADSATGFRRLVQRGNCGSRLSRTVGGLPLGQPIYWSVQAIDTAFAGGPFAPEAVFTLAPVPGTNGIASGGVPGDLNGDGIVDQYELNTVLSNYFPHSPWLLMTNVAGLGGTNVTFALSNSTAGSFTVEYSTNLATWYPLGPATPRYLFTDTNAPGQPQRFYRLRWP